MNTYLNYIIFNSFRYSELHFVFSPYIRWSSGIIQICFLLCTLYLSTLCYTYKIKVSAFPELFILFDIFLSCIHCFHTKCKLLFLEYFFKTSFSTPFCLLSCLQPPNPIMENMYIYIYAHCFAIVQALFGGRACPFYFIESPLWNWFYLPLACFIFQFHILLPEIFFT